MFYCMGWELINISHTAPVREYKDLILIIRFELAAYIFIFKKYLYLKKWTKCVYKYVFYSNMKFNVLSFVVVIASTRACRHVGQIACSSLMCICFWCSKCPTWSSSRFVCHSCRTRRALSHSRNERQANRRTKTPYAGTAIHGE